MTGLEPAASCSQSKRATNCATPRNCEVLENTSIQPNSFGRPLAVPEMRMLAVRSPHFDRGAKIALPASAAGGGRALCPKQARYQLQSCLHLGRMGNAHSRGAATPSRKRSDLEPPRAPHLEMSGEWARPIPNALALYYKSLRKSRKSRHRGKPLAILPQNCYNSVKS